MSIYGDRQDRIWVGTKEGGVNLYDKKKKRFIRYNKIFDEKDVPVTTLNYVYTGDEITEEKTVDGNDKVTGIILKEYLNGQLVSQTEKDGDGNVTSISRYKRNTSNDVVECITTITRDNKDFKLTYEYEYDSAGNWIKQTQYYEGAIINIILRNIEYFKS
jgi:hypothetical protein